MFDFAIIHFRNWTARNRTMHWLLGGFSRNIQDILGISDILMVHSIPNGDTRDRLGYLQILVDVRYQTWCLARYLDYFPHVCWHLTDIYPILSKT